MNIHEIDGPPVAFFDLNGRRVQYIVYSYAADDAGVLVQMLAGYRRDAMARGLCIVWRQRPRIEGKLDDDGVHRWRLYMRCALVEQQELENCDAPPLTTATAPHEECAPPTHVPR